MDSYTFTNGLAYDIGAGVYVADSAPGWGLGAYAFLLGGIGRITSDLGSGSRYFGEGGGGLQSGPFGVEFSVKVGWNKLSEPVEHHFLNVPIDPPRDGELLMSPRVEAWLASAIDDAERRGLPELKPLLEALARTMTSLRAADIEYARVLEQRADAGPGRSREA